MHIRNIHKEATMKKLSLALVILLVLAIMLPSCKEKKPESADELWNKIDEVMDSTESYRTDITMDLTMYTMGEEVKMTAEGYSLYSQKGGHGDYNYNKSVVKSDKLGIDQTSETVKAFIDGTLYIYDKSDGKESGKYATVSEKEYEEYTELSGGLFDIDVEEGATKTFSQQSDGSWLLEISEYPEETVNKAFSSIGFDRETAGGKAKDLKVSVKADEKYRVSTMSFVFEFEADGGAEKVPTFAMEATYSGYGSTSVSAELIDTSKYEKKEDLVDREKIETLARKLYNHENVKMSAKIRGKVYAGAEIVSDIKEDDEINYGIRDGGYFFDLTAQVYSGSSSYEVKMAYADGKLSTEVDGQKEVTQANSMAAKAYIDTSVQLSLYSDENITSVTDNGNGVYEVTLDLSSMDQYKAAFEGTGESLKSAEGIALITIEDDGIKSIKLSVNVVSTMGTYKITKTLDLTVLED